MFSASESVKKTEVKEEPATVESKTEKETPKKQSPKKKEVCEGGGGRRMTSQPRKTFHCLQPAKTPKTASGKASISSFFSKSTSAGAAKHRKEVATPPIKKEESSNMFDEQTSMEVDDTATESKEQSPETKQTTATVATATTNIRKRSIVDVDGETKLPILWFDFFAQKKKIFSDDDCDEIPGTPQESKKARKIQKKTAEKSKHSRIVKMEDSSDDDGKPLPLPTDHPTSHLPNFFLFPPQPTTPSKWNC